jgi:hypothetical protein
MVDKPSGDPAKPDRGPARPRHRRRRPRTPQLTDRDVEIVRWITRHGVVTTEQVARKFFWRDETQTVGMWAAYRRIAALRDLGLVLRDKPFATKPDALRVTRKGADLADISVHHARLVLSQLSHTIELVALTEHLLAEHPGAELTTERELRAERYRDLRVGQPMPSGGRIPDAILRIPKQGGGEETIAVELDMSRKDRRQLEDIVHRYDREPVDQVWWYVRATRVQRIRDIVLALRADDRIEVRQWPA